MSTLDKSDDDFSEYTSIKNQEHTLTTSNAVSMTSTQGKDSHFIYCKTLYGYYVVWLLWKLLEITSKRSVYMTASTCPIRKPSSLTQRRSTSKSSELMSPPAVKSALVGCKLKKGKNLNLKGLFGLHFITASFIHGNHHFEVKFNALHFCFTIVYLSSACSSVRVCVTCVCHVCVCVCACVCAALVDPSKMDWDRFTNLFRNMFAQINVVWLVLQCLTCASDSFFNRLCSMLTFLGDIWNCMKCIRVRAV